MDFPKSVPGVGLVNNQFVDEDPVNGTPGSLIPANWGNAVTKELLAVIQAAGLAPSEEQQDQLLKAVRKLRGGAVNFGLWQFSATGGNPAAGRLTLNNADPALASALLIAESSAEALDYSPSLGMLRAGDTISIQERDAATVSHRYRVTGPAVDNGTYRSIPVSYVSGSGGSPAVDAMLSVLLTQNNAAEASTDGIAGSISNLKASATGANASVAVTADAVCVKNAAGQQKVLNGLALAINSATTGANGLDAGALAASTWYSVWVIWNGATAAGLLSLSETAPALPAGYTHKARVGWIRTDGTANKYPLAFTQRGAKVRYEVLAGSNVTSYPAVASGIASSPIEASLANHVPPTAAAAHMAAGCVSGYVGFSPVGSFAATPSQGYLSPAQPNGFPFAGGYNASGPVPTTTGEIVLKTRGVLYCATAAQSILQCMGWDDNL